MTNSRKASWAEANSSHRSNMVLPFRMGPPERIILVGSPPVWVSTTLTIRRSLNRITPTR